MGMKDMDKLGVAYDEVDIKVALIYADPGLENMFTCLAKDAAVEATVIRATLDDAVAIGRKLESKVDAIISRGGTAEYIRNAVSVPVVTVPMTFYDVLYIVNAIKDRVKEVAFFKYREKLPGIKYMEEICGIKIHEYTFIEHHEIEEAMREASSQGIKTMIGGVAILQYAKKLDLEGILVMCGEETVSRALGEALNVVRVQRLERKRTARVEKILDSITEGIIVTDEKNRITVYNPAAARIFKIPSSSVLGRQVQKVIPNTRLHEVLKTGEPETAQLQEVKGEIIATSRVPILLDGTRIGVVGTFEDVTKIQLLEQQIRKRIYTKGFIAKYSFADILTVNQNMLELKKMAELYASTNSTVLIQGESGTGKELFAQSIHNASNRRSGAFVAVNCAAIPESLLESELFGYIGGAFTGAKKAGQSGLFELAHGGTIFLDEIGEIPSSLQARLLRVLQEKEIRRVGDDKIIPVDIRIISATNQELRKNVEQGSFRGDLYYRLNVFSVKIPPLRDRREDIPLLAGYFLKNLNVDVSYDELVKKMGSILMSYDWPGNIRELSNAMERLALMMKHAPEQYKWEKGLQKLIGIVSEEENGLFAVKVNVNNGLKVAVDQFEKNIIDMMLKIYGQNQEIVARKLGIAHTTLWRKIKKEMDDK